MPIHVLFADVFKGGCDRHKALVVSRCQQAHLGKHDGWRRQRRSYVALANVTFSRSLDSCDFCYVSHTACAWEKIQLEAEAFYGQIQIGSSDERFHLFHLLFLFDCIQQAEFGSQAVSNVGFLAVYESWGYEGTIGTRGMEAWSMALGGKSRAYLYTHFLFAWSTGKHCITIRVLFLSLITSWIPFLGKRKDVKSSWEARRISRWMYHVYWESKSRDLECHAHIWCYRGAEQDIVS
jgi:hypothetical protein